MRGIDHLCPSRKIIGAGKTEPAWIQLDRYDVQARRRATRKPVENGWWGLNNWAWNPHQHYRQWESHLEIESPITAYWAGYWEQKNGGHYSEDRVPGYYGKEAAEKWVEGFRRARRETIERLEAKKRKEAARITGQKEKVQAALVAEQEKRKADAAWRAKACQQFRERYRRMAALLTEEDRQKFLNSPAFADFEHWSRIFGFAKKRPSAPLLVPPASPKQNYVGFIQVDGKWISQTCAASSLHEAVQIMGDHGRFPVYGVPKEFE